MNFAKSKLHLNYCLLSFPKVTVIMAWGQSRHEGEMPGRGKPSPSGMPHIIISLALLGTSQGHFCLHGKWDSLGGENVSVRIQALLHWLSRPSYGKPLQIFVDLLIKHWSINSFSGGGVWRGRKTRMNLQRNICTHSQFYVFVHLLHCFLLQLTHTLSCLHTWSVKAADLSYSSIIAWWQHVAFHNMYIWSLFLY